MNIGNRIKEIRIAKNLSQKEIALAVDINRGQFSRIENNKVEPNLSSLKKIAEALGVPVSELFKESGDYNLDSYDKSLVEKVKLIHQLNEEQQKVVFFIVDSLSANQRFKSAFETAFNG